MNIPILIILGMGTTLTSFTLLSYRLKAFHFFKAVFQFMHIIFGLIALELGGSMMLGTCQEAYYSGFYGILYVIGISIGFMLLGFGFASRMKAMNVENTIDLFEARYQSPFLRTAASILSTITVGGLLIGQIIAAKSLLQGLGITSEYIFLACFLLVLSYTIIGGLRGAGITYQAQLIYTVLLFGGIFAFCILKEPPSFFTDIVNAQNLFPQSDTSFSTIFASLVMPALYYLTDQEFARPLFEISNKKVATAAAVTASLFMMLFSIVPIYFGIKAKMLNVQVTDEVSPLIRVLQVLTNDWIVFFAVCGILAALIAVIDYYLWSLSMGITQEVRLAFKIKESEKLDKIMVFVVGLISLAASYCTTSNAIQVLLGSYELYDSCLIVPLIMSYFQPQLKKGAAVGAIAFGLTGFILFRLYPISIPGEVASLSLSFIGFYCGSWIEKMLYKISIIPLYSLMRYKIKFFTLVVLQFFS